MNDVSKDQAVGDLALVETADDRARLDDAAAPLAAQSTRTPGVLCPYCGHRQPAGDRCTACKGLFEPLSRQATQNAMGPWSIRSERNPFAPGCSYEKLKEMVAKGRINGETVVRGPTTRQFWALARDVQGVAVLLGACHNCKARVGTDDYTCRSCGTVLTCGTDRQHLGLAPVKLLPGDGSPREVASSGMGRSATRPASPMPATPAPRPLTETTPIDPAILRDIQPRNPADNVVPAGDSALSLRTRLANKRARKRRQQARGTAAVLAAFVVIAGGIAVLSLGGLEPRRVETTPPSSSQPSNPATRATSDDALARALDAIGPLDTLGTLDALRQAREQLAAAIAGSPQSPRLDEARAMLARIESAIAAGAEPVNAESTR